MSFDFPCPKCEKPYRWTGKPANCGKCGFPFKSLRAEYLRLYKEKIYDLTKEEILDTKTRANRDFPPIRLSYLANRWLSKEVNFLKAEMARLKSRKEKQEFRRSHRMNKQEIVSQAVYEYLAKHGHVSELE